MDAPQGGQPLAAVALLGDPHRRALYEFAVGENRLVSRDEAAAAAGLTRPAAAFHLDRLVAGGLLEVEFRRLGSRRGPGAGRPSKLYRRAGRDIAVSLPPRRYDIAGHLLAEAVTVAERRGTAPSAVVEEVAYEYGRRLGEAARRSASAMAGTSPAALLVDLLAQPGYEPRLAGARIELANCPFHSLVDSHRELVCRMNLALVRGAINGLHAAGLSAVADPASARCCVAVASEKER